ncbi:MAG: N-acetyl-gamma-glutamyl-phosphate reductase [Armatimonadota bacterium]|nr:N-acetyl-gamma-glutamyl-phosphate reductase [Armatimonadota bacterium]MDW8024731.1 N-acetyl-gamma-glutamyl-phosphate reductase [Armatimonadota bacterium]
MPVKVGIVGATGYTGGELVRFLMHHPEVELVHLMRLTSEEELPLEQVHPNLRQFGELKCMPMDEIKLAKDVDVAFLAVPHGVAMSIAAKLLDMDLRVIDLSADFRLKDVATFESWYRTRHNAPHLLEEAVYGLPEVYRDRIRDAKLVANPGCYPVSAILALLPLLRLKILHSEHIVIDSKSGVSGAGRSKTTIDYHYPEVFGDFKPYGIATHRHTPEIEQELSYIAGRNIRVTFTPHLLPVSRGILTTAYVLLEEDISASELHEAYKQAYKNEPFVRVLPIGVEPRLKGVIGSNFCDVNIFIDERTKCAIAVSAIDNLAKGAASNAIQNMNLMFGLDEKCGLMIPPISP